MSLNFIENNKEDIVKLNQKVSLAIKNLNIDTSGALSIAKCIKIAGFDIPKESCSRRWYETPNNWIGHQLRARTWKPNLKF